MKVLLVLCLLQVTVSPSFQACTELPADLNGTWTSSGLGTIEISSSAMTLSTTTTFSASTSISYFECQFNSGTQYVFKMNETTSILSGTLAIYAYGCFDFRQTSANSYYFYLNSAKEVTLSNLRFTAVLVSSVSNIDSITDICDSSTVDIAEFYTMVKSGSEQAAISAVQCPDPILGRFDYTYKDQTGTYCDTVNTSTILACSNQSHAELVVDNTGCTTAQPFYSSGGELGCVASVYVSSLSTYYVSLYNKDATLSTSSSRFTCVAMQQQSNGTVFLSLAPNNCAAGQSAIIAPTITSSTETITGATMVLEPFCVPENHPVVKKTSWVWLIIFVVCLGALIILIILIIFLHRHCKHIEKKRAREKKILITEEHPLGEMSIALDAPASMERVPEGYIEVNNEFFRSPRSFKKKDMMNPMGESSMNLNFKEKSWHDFTPRKSISGPVDPFTEMDSGIVLPISSIGSKTARSMRSPTKQKSFIFDTRTPRTPRSEKKLNNNDQLAITDGRIPYPMVGADEGFEESMFNIRESMSRSQTVYAPSIRAPSVHAPNKIAHSIRAPSVRAPSVKAPSIAAKSTKSVNNNLALSIHTNKTSKPTPKITRSVTSTRLGSVTKRTPQSSPRKKRMNRSKTMVMSTENHDTNEGGMADFMNAEMTNSVVASEAGRSRRSQRTARSTVSRPKTSTKATPRKPILKKKSKYMSSEEFLTEEEKYSQFLTDEKTSPPSNSASVNGSAGRSLQDAYNDMERRNNPLSRLRRVGATRKQWH